MTNLQVHTILVTPFQQNARILYDQSTLAAVIIDPGGEAEKISKFIESKNLKVQAIWLTHSHIDHCGGVADLLEKYPVSLLGHANEKEFRQKVVEICQAYGVLDADLKNCPEPTQFVKGGETLALEQHEFKVIFCPGHSPGHVCFYNAANSLLVAGDTLFSGSIGRTDLPGGNHEQLISEINKKLLGLPLETRVLSGHGPDTTIGHEKENNQWLQ